MPPPPLDPEGGAHTLVREGVGESHFRRGDIGTGRRGTLAGERGGGGVPFPTRGHTYTVVLGGGEHSLAREGVGESQFRRGEIHCGTLYLYVICGLTCPFPSSSVCSRTDDDIWSREQL